MRHEPRALVRDLEGSVELVRAHTLLGRAQEEERKQPLVQRDVGSLKDRSNGDGVLLAARGALPQAPRLGLQPIRRPLTLAAVRAHRAIWPADGLKICGCRLCVVEARIEDAEVEVVKFVTWHTQS